MKKLMFIVLVMAVMAGSALAGPVGPYRLAFTTSVNIDSTSSDIATYNAYVQGLANASALNIGAAQGITWNVIGSTATVDARDNTGTAVIGVDDVPIYLVDGTTLVANGNADLWGGVYIDDGGQNNTGGIQGNINMDENGNARTLWPHTGTGLDGTADMPFGNGGDVRQGQGSDPSRWIWRQWTQRPQTNTEGHYAISSVIPEPATMCLLGLGGLFLRRRRNS